MCKYAGLGNHSGKGKESFGDKEDVEHTDPGFVELSTIFVIQGHLLGRNAILLKAFKSQYLSPVS